MTARFRPIVAAVILLSLSGLAGCGRDNSDLDAYIASVKAQPAGEIPPIPAIQSYIPFEYPEHTLDPFDKTIVSPRMLPHEVSQSNIKIDRSRPKEFLENFPLDALKMVGTLMQSGSLWALIKTPDGTIQRVRNANHLGQNHGRVTQISESRLDLIEIVPDGLGGYKERPASIALSNR